MRFPKFVDLSLSVRGLSVLASLFLLSAAVSGQKIPEANASADLDQCRNGATGTDPCVGINWVNGNLGNSNSQYAEDEYIPYRIVFSDLTPGTNYTVVLGYDTSKNGKHAIDYLGGVNDFKILNRLTELAGIRNVDACDGGTTCSGIGNPLTIPQDPLVLASINPFTLGPVYQPQSRVIRMFGATPTSFAYTANNIGNDVERQVTITFTANLATAVLAWSGHVAFAGDWGIGSSAAGIQGSSYHMRVEGFGETGNVGSGHNQDRSVSADAVTVAAFINIIKVANTSDGSGTAITPFPFTATANFGTTSFNLIDNVAGSAGALQQSNAITVFGVGNAVTVNEENISGWTLLDISCDVNSSASFTKSIPAQPAPHAGSVTVTLTPGGVATCTFSNSQLQTTAAPATVSGRVLSADGTQLVGVPVVLTDLSTGETRSSRSNSFGYFFFDNCVTEHFYILRVVNTKRYSFSSDTRSFTLFDDLADTMFVADP